MAKRQVPKELLDAVNKIRPEFGNQIFIDINKNLAKLKKAKYKGEDRENIIKNTYYLLEKYGRENKNASGELV